MEFLFTLLAVIVGWLLNELSNIIQGKSTEKKSLRLALFKALEIRQKLVFIHKSISTAAHATDSCENMEAF